MNQSDLKHPDITKFGWETARDENGRLYLPGFRALMEPFSVDKSAVEAIAAVRAAGKFLHLIQDRWLDKYGLSEGRLGVLFRLHRCGDTALGDLADALESTPRNITGLVDHLERDGLVERVPDPEDRRSVRARLTAAGRERIEGIWGTGMEKQVELVQGMSEEDVAQLRHLCLALVENIRKELGK
jgi:DNA-binding MarR family transcriptional regulator